MRFIVKVHVIRDVKDALSREIIAALESEAIASATIEIAGIPPLKIEDPQRTRETLEWQ